MLPFGQGALDYLCGVYSIVNADHLINGSKNEDSKEFFDAIINFLDEEGMIGTALKEGMLFKTLTAILTNIANDRISYQKPYSGVPKPGLGDFWDYMMDFMNGNAKGNKRVILLGIYSVDIGGHWTVASKVTPKQIKLYDSISRFPLKRLNRLDCTTSENGNRRHILFPAQTYFLANAGRFS